ncbi:MAG: hypothetical protein J6Q54_09165, partial [Oscillospiraceae bacterium]|nr:hypothetical protein [Oscillospiraceae bacterium]
MLKHARFIYQPVRPLGKDGRMITGCDAHFRLCKDVLAEGTVLMKNQGVLPLPEGTKFTLFGLGGGDFIFGGGGSGVVVTKRKISLHQGLQEAANKGMLQYFPDVATYCYDAIENMLEEKKAELPVLRDFTSWRRNYQMELPELPEELYQKAKAFGGTALFCISRYSAEGDDGGDRKGGKGDFYLWD